MPDLLTFPLHSLALDDAAMFWYSAVEPVPSGFVALRLDATTLPGQPMLWLVPDLSALQAAWPDYHQRLTGLLLTPAREMAIKPLAEQLWQVALPLSMLDSCRVWLRGWFVSLQQAADWQQQNQALAACLAQQSDALLRAHDDLCETNRQLERRVLERTLPLAEMNAALKKKLFDLQQDQGELVRSAQLSGLGFMVAGIAHELNTPIGNALTVATSLHQEALQLHSSLQNGNLKRSTLERHAGSTLQITQVMERNLQRAADAIAHFKQLAVEQVNEQRRRFSLSDAISDVLVSLSPVLHKCAHRVEVVPAEPIMMDSFPGALCQVLGNLLQNAATHAFEAGEVGLIRIESRVVSGARVQLTVSDTGCGIPEQDQQRVFDPFFTTKLGQGGSGLGLHIAYNLTTVLLGGDIKISTNGYHGTRIVLTLPQCIALTGPGSMSIPATSPATTQTTTPTRTATVVPLVSMVPTAARATQAV
jgi:signal transduction histidine kinase